MIGLVWRQTATDVVLGAAVVTAVLTLWARLFAGPIGRWVDARISVATKPMENAIDEMRDSNTRQHAEVRSTLEVLKVRLDDHIDSANEWRATRQGDHR